MSAPALPTQTADPFREVLAADVLCAMGLGGLPGEGVVQAAYMPMGSGVAATVPVRVSPANVHAHSAVDGTQAAPLGTPRPKSGQRLKAVIVCAAVGTEADNGQAVQGGKVRLLRQGDVFTLPGRALNIADDSAVVRVSGQVQRVAGGGMWRAEVEL